MNIELKPIAESKVRQLGGEVFGVAIRDKRGRFAAITEMGFVTWLDEDKGGEYAAYLEGMNSHLKAELEAARAQGACEWAEQLDACEFHGNDHEVCAEYSGQVPCARAQSGQGADAVKWSDPAVDPIVSKLYRKFKEWNRQGFGADDVTWCEVRGYVAELLNAQPQHAQQWSVPEGWRLRVLSEFPLLNDDGLDQEKHHCEWSIQQDRKRLHSVLSATPQPEGDGWVLMPKELTAESGAKSLLAGEFHEVVELECGACDAGACWYY